MEILQNNIQQFRDLSIDQVFIKLHSSSQGLTRKEAKRRLTIVGTNEMVRKRYPLIWQAILYSANPLVGILLIAAAFCFLLFVLSNNTIQHPFQV